MVSRDFAFLDKITTCICDVEAETIRKYHGIYSDFLVQKKHLREDHIRRYKAQKKVIERTEDFIRRNITGTNSKNAKGRRKQLAHLERIAPPVFTSRPMIHFQKTHSEISRSLEVQNLVMGYDAPLLPSLSFSMMGGDKLAVTGFNGIGKSTLLKTLLREILVLAGPFHFAEQIRIGYYEQEFDLRG